jgi:hypothetical protein
MFFMKLQYAGFRQARSQNTGYNAVGGKFPVMAGGGLGHLVWVA